MELSEQIRRIAKSRHMSIHALSVMADIPYSTLYSVIVRNTQKVDQAMILKLASALNLDEQFFTDDFQASDNSSPEETKLRETIATIIGRKNRVLCLSVINDFLVANKDFIEATITRNTLIIDNDQTTE